MELPDHLAPVANELMRLANVLATTRVRRAIVYKGVGGPGETLEGTERRVQRAEAELREAICKALTDEHRS